MMFSQAAPTGVQAPGGLALTDALAVAALALAVVALVLDVWFFISTSREQREFLSTLGQRQDHLFDQMNSRQDRLVDKQIDVLNQTAGVLAQVSERARIVQEQVDKQMVRLTDYVITQASSDVKRAGNQFSDDLQATIQHINQQVTELSETRATDETIPALKNEFTRLSARVAALPDLLAATTSNSVRSAAQQESWDSTPAYVATFRAIVREIIEAGPKRSLNIRDLQDRVERRVPGAKNTQGSPRRHDVERNRHAGRASWRIRAHAGHGARTGQTRAERSRLTTRPKARCAVIRPAQPPPPHTRNLTVPTSLARFARESVSGLFLSPRQLTFRSLRSGLTSAPCTACGSL